MTRADGEDYVVLRDHLVDLLNPPDDDAAEVSILIKAVVRAVRWIEQQPCVCPGGNAELDYDEACERCAALGRSRNDLVPR